MRCCGTCGESEVAVAMDPDGFEVCEILGCVFCEARGCEVDEFHRPCHMYEPSWWGKGEGSDDGEVSK